MGRMTGKVALISGGAEGIGAHVARLIVAEGGSVMLGDIQIDKARALAAELGGHADAVLLDVRELAQWEAAVAATQARFGKLTVLCNIAGISEPGTVPDGTLDVWHRTIDINLHGPFYGMRAAIPAMEASGEPCAIVNIGSMSALVGQPFLAPYAGSKGALATLTRHAGFALMRHRIHVNQLDIGWMNSDHERALVLSETGDPDFIDRAAAQASADGGPADEWSDSSETP